MHTTRSSQHVLHFSIPMMFNGIILPIAQSSSEEIIHWKTRTQCAGPVCRERRVQVSIHAERCRYLLSSKAVAKRRSCFGLAPVKISTKHLILLKDSKVPVLPMRR